MAVTPTHKVRITPVLREYFQALGADVKGWPKGWKQAVADRTGGTLNAIGSTRSRLARTWPTHSNACARGYNALMRRPVWPAKNGSHLGA